MSKLSQKKKEKKPENNHAIENIVLFKCMFLKKS